MMHVNDKNGTSQVDLFSFFGDEKPMKGQGQENISQVNQDASVVLDFNTGDDSAKTPDSMENAPSTEDEAPPIPISAAPPGMPVFEYAGASEPIKNLQITFEDLRKEKSKDFPELEKKEKVSWTVDYGIFKAINDTNKTIAKAKSEIESSKEFLDALRKSKKPIICKVKPRVSGQTKGVISAYKGVFINLEDVAKSKKLISILPSRDGRVYEIRNTEIGLFVTRTQYVEELDPIVPCFRMKLPKIPVDLIQQTIAFFRNYIHKDNVVEVMVNLLWDRQDKKYAIYVPEQVVSKTSIKAAPSEFDEGRYLHVADIHSHNTMPAKFSATDNEDELATRLYIIIGKLDRYFPEINARISNGGKYHQIDPSAILEGMAASYPSEWHYRVSIAPNAQKEDADSFMECDAA